jgi:hypothetical protein
MAKAFSPTALLAGPYHPPALRRGDRAYCRFRRARVVITGRTNGRIRWLLCLSAGSFGRGGYFVDKELVRAIRNESAAALMYWFGANKNTVVAWRKAFGVTSTNNPGTARLIEKRNETMRKWQMSPEQRELQRRIAIELNSAQYFAKYRRSNGPDWTAKEIALLGTDVDRVIAEKVGRSVEAVNRKRKKLGIPRIPDRLDRSSQWTKAQIRLFRTDDDKTIAAKTGRTTVSVRMKRRRLRIARKRDWRKK